ncbi:MAG: hypothetical protein JSR77_07175 [Planctomycetes bacterium]|nr:hypothetical protein [Planctomycetota bacterium]
MFPNRLVTFVLATSMAAVFLAWMPLARAQSPAGPAFTYQGELRADGVPLDGACDFKFRLYDAATGSGQVGPELSVPGVNVLNGLFTTQLNFGSSPFVGQARWLEISVRNSGSGAAYTVLAPRQALTATPYALYAINGPAGPAGPQGPAGPVGIIASVDTQFSEDDRSGWVHVETMSDDTCFSNIPLGFTFTGWGRANTTVSVSSNGLLFFGQQCSASFTNTTLPSGISNDPFLAFFWDDLFDHGSAEYFEYATFGSPGGRVFNLFFRNGLLSTACGSNVINVMISIHEGTNLIHCSYSNMTGCYNMRGGSATFGLQGPGGAGASAYTVSVDAPILDDNASRQSISFQPPRQ